jgi:DNA-binding NarL/FixJ family response regulator
MRPSRPVRVLLADDHVAILAGLRDLIASQDQFRVVGAARNGREALRLAEELSPHIAVLDYALPEMNGLDLAQAIKRARPEVEILLYSMHDRDEIITGALRAGVRGFVVKSDTGESVIAGLEALAAGRPYFSPSVSDSVLNQFLKSAPSGPNSVLTPRERQIVQLVAEGKTNKVIASHLEITVKTVETHRSSAMRKMKVRTTAELVRWAIRNNLAQA